MKHFKETQIAKAKTEEFFEHLKSVSDEQLQEYIQEAIRMGISQDQINLGLKTIKQIKKSH